MSDQISEKMANKIFDANEQFNASGLCSRRERFISALKHFGLIKPSKLDEAREWAIKKSVYPPSHGPWEIGYTDGVRDATERFESAITEILEDKS